jgi:prophage regulatory protein
MYIKIRGFQIWGVMRFTQSNVDELWIYSGMRDHTTFDQGMPGFGIYRADDGKTTYVVEYVQASKLIRKKIGKTRKISLKKARKAAMKILRKIPAAERHEPAPPSKNLEVRPTAEPDKPTRVKRRRRIIAEMEPETILVQAGRTIFKDGNGPRRLLRYDDLDAKRGIKFTRQHLSRLEAAGKFPKRVQVGAHHIAWVESEIDGYLEKIMAERLPPA